jgi:hypothetical protein
VNAAEWAHAGFALGYAEHGTFPVAKRTRASCLAIQETALQFDSPQVAPLIIEAGRAEGKRSARETEHRKLYDFHSAALAGALGVILKRLDVDAVATQVSDHAAALHAAGSDPVARRRSVAGLVLAAIRAQLHAEDRQTLDGINQDGWAHATAYGQAEAQATSAKGGPPVPKLVAGLAATALVQISKGEAESAAASWTTLQLQTIAMGAALAAGDGSALGDAARAVKASLIDTGRATAAYADQLHGAVVQSFIAGIQAKDAEARFDWVTDADPCPDCEDYEIEGPYAAEDLPDFPAHPSCRCDIEQEAASLVNA